MRIEVKRLSDTCGGEICGLDPSVCKDSDIRHELRDALFDRLILLFRYNRVLSTQEQLDLTAVFGEVVIPWDSNHKHPDDPRVQLVSNAGREGINYKTSTLYWHTDQSFTRFPSLVTVLHSVAAPPVGGNTLFADTRAAYDALSDVLKLQLHGRQARHSFGYLMKELMRRRLSKDISEAEHQRFPDVIHPLVRSHPVTLKRALFGSELCVDKILGMASTESDALIKHLIEFCTQPAFIYTHKWRVGDVLVWDNASLIHRAEDIPSAPLRKFHRTNTSGSEPR